MTALEIVQSISCTVAEYVPRFVVRKAPVEGSEDVAAAAERQEREFERVTAAILKALAPFREAHAAVAAAMREVFDSPCAESGILPP